MDIRKFFGDTESVEEKKLSFHSVEQLREMRGKITSVIDDLDKMILSFTLLSGGYEKDPKKEGYHRSKCDKHHRVILKNGNAFFYESGKESKNSSFNTETCPYGRSYDFCSNCRSVPEKEHIKLYGNSYRGKDKTLWQCMCS